MVLLNPFANIDDQTTVPTCRTGHVTVCVTRGARLCRVCPSCLRLALLPDRAAGGPPPTTVNDYLAQLEAGDGTPPALPAAEAESAAKLLRAAAELYGSDADFLASACRKVVRDVAKAERTTTKDVMRWTLARMTLGLSVLSRQLSSV